MYKTIVDYLCCPICRANLALQSESEVDGDVLEGSLSCECGHTFRISQGVADFNSEEQGFANQWESMSDERNFGELDREMDANNPLEVVKRREMVLGAIVGAISNYNCNIVLDIASGRGLLLTELIKNLSDDVHIISIDLSAFVLKYDHHKFKRIAPTKKINYLACDATNLPLKDSVVDAAATYCGFSNMLGVTEQALQEVHRVIRPTGILVDSYVVIQKASKGYETLQQVCAKQGLIGAEEFFLHEGLTKQHGDLFSVVECNVIFEGIGVDNGMDLLPYDGEWYAEQVFFSEK